MRIALIAHDNKKQEMVHFSMAYEGILEKHELFATGTTGKKVMAATNLNVTRFQSGPLGGDQQIGSLIAQNAMDLVLFFRDPLTPQPHEPDISALIRLCDVYQIPVATNVAAGELFIRALERGDLDWRKIIKEREDRHE
ncbi:methylglyoxal synthase [Fictibacillus macauensis ZFHKF-1]|uniref:Methylglyoxal synthase n=1 Tax=Fictibacillus macauensis ZFHKF-1 TaxID=1196324 RepID=I8AL65_9BACL|nr:methylglyoxal synthase [Fictibacillus macauensis]EIT86612.1 methylglyoxal synthase [Fictibacillus macauensis ZFHKF-1]